MCFIDELRSVPTKRHIIADNLLNSVHPTASAAREEINTMWDWYRQLAERDFPLRFAVDPQSKYWEMYLAYTLRDFGFSIRRKQEGPDFWIESDGGPIWIEATAPDRGDDKSPDLVPEPVPNQADYVPTRQIVLRLTGAIQTKQLKYRDYLRRGLVGPDDRYVIALSPAKLRYPVTIDYLQRAVYEAGDLYVAFDRVSLGMVAEGRHHEPQTAKSDREPFDKPSFVDASCSHVSALLFGGRGIGNMPPVLGADLSLLHNYGAAHPLSQGWLKRGSEHWIEVDDEAIHLESRLWH